MGILKRRMNKIVQDVDDMKVDFQDALEEKGIEEPGNSLPEYPEKILEIETGGGGGSVLQNRVRYFDIDGTLLKEELLEDGQTTTPPTPPNHADLGMSFYEWAALESDLAHVYTDLDVVASYQGDGQSNVALALLVSAAAGVAVTIPFQWNSSDTDPYQIKWGVDGQWEDVAGPQTRTFENGFEGWVLLRAAAGVATYATAISDTSGAVRGVVLINGQSPFAQETAAMIRRLDFLYECHGAQLTQVSSLPSFFFDNFSTRLQLLALCDFAGTLQFYKEFINSKLVLAIPYVNAISFVNGRRVYVNALYAPRATAVSGNTSNNQGNTASKYFVFDTFCAPSGLIVGNEYYEKLMSVRKHYRGYMFASNPAAQYFSPQKYVTSISGNNVLSGNLDFTPVQKVVFICATNTGILGDLKGAFDFCFKAENGGDAVIRLAGDLTVAPYVDPAFFEHLFNCLVPNGSQIISMGQVNYDLVPDSVKSIATDKGYTLTA